MLHIHPNARTTPATRAEIARSREPSGTVAQRYGISAETVRKWRQRGASDCLDRSARPHRLPWKATEKERAGVLRRWISSGLGQAAAACSNQRNGWPDRRMLCRATDSLRANATRILPMPYRFAIACAQSFRLEARLTRVSSTTAVSYSSHVALRCKPFARAERHLLQQPRHGRPRLDRHRLGRVLGQVGRSLRQRPRRPAAARSLMTSPPGTRSASCQTGA